jgi:hypothetical protein
MNYQPRLPRSDSAADGFICPACGGFVQLVVKTLISESGSVTLAAEYVHTCSPNPTEMPTYMGAVA